jgi:2-aminoethylphosphonate-pyruvate transaminase
LAEKRRGGILKRTILFNPGPGTTSETVKRALLVPDICPREKEFQEVISEVRAGITKVVNGQDNFSSVLFAGSGTAAMEACIASCIRPSTKVLIINNGAYGKRFVQIANTYKLPVVELEFPSTETPNLSLLEKTLSDDKNISTVVVVHHETTTGILNPAKEIGAISKKLGRTVIVDAMSSFGGIPIDAQTFNADFIISSSNKCLHGMAGIAFVVCRKSALLDLKASDGRSYYLNIREQFDCLEKTGQTQFTPPVQILYALRQALREFFEEGQEARYQRYTENWNQLRQGMKALGFKPLLQDQIESKVLMTLYEPSHPKFDFNKFHDRLFTEGFTIYPGKIHSADTFRLAIIGELSSKDIGAFLKQVEVVGKEMGFLQAGAP